MKHEKESGFGERFGTLVTSAATAYLLLYAVGWLLERKWGALLIIWALWFFGALIVLGAALTAITGDYDLGDRAWPWVVFAGAATLMTCAQWRECAKCTR